MKQLNLQLKIKQTQQMTSEVKVESLINRMQKLTIEVMCENCRTKKAERLITYIYYWDGVLDERKSSRYCRSCTDEWIPYIEAYAAVHSRGSLIWTNLPIEPN